MTAHEQFELVWPALQMGEAIYCEWPQVVHVRVTFGKWDERFLMLETGSATLSRDLWRNDDVRKTRVITPSQF